MAAAASTRIIAIRHGETDWNLAGRIQGHEDIPLNRTGRWQAGRLAQALDHEDIAAVYASDLARARQTAEALAGGRALAVHLDPGLRERGFGVFEGLTFAQVQARWPEQARRWRQRDPDFAPAGGESLQAFNARCIAAAHRLARAHRGDTIALVSHGGVLDGLYRAALRLDLAATRTWLLANAGINRLLHSDAGFSLVGWADVLHLDAPLDEQVPVPPVFEGDPRAG